MKRYMTFALALAIVAAPIALAKKGNKTQVAQNLNIFSAIYKELQTSYVDSLDSNKDIRNAIDAMLGQIDPYTEYYPIEEQEALTQISSGEFSGIGSYIMQRNGQVVLSEPQWGSPARTAGVKHGDVLIAIDGDTLPRGFSSSEASKRLRGQAGTHVHLTVKRPFVQDSILDFDIVRGTIRTDPVPYYGMLRDGVGYIRLTTFNEKSAAGVKEGLLALKKNPDLKGVVLDLRDNGGGLLESAVQIVGFFVPKGTEVVSTRYRDSSNEKTYKTTQQPIDTEIPLAVLVNGGTASASEIVSGSLQDLDRAVIIGERSYGKGLVQSSRPLPYDGLLKLTVARYYIPSGRLIQAIDYSHRNPDGSVARIPDSLTNVYQTRAGREVRDGGGITPDIKVEQPEANRLIYNVVADLWSYDYANRFAARQGDNMPPAAEFEITDSIFEDFKAFIDPDKFQYDKLCESGIKMLREAAESEGYMTDSVSSQFDILEGLLKHNLNHDLDHNRKELVRILDSEISARYYSEGDRVMRDIRDDLDVDAAIEMFTTPGEYQKLLSPAGAGKKP
ncbi:MAG: S41 family peptidase [Bacteroidales bacterium]|nr:S41 family peptidase [Bacteroidales bacterium]